MASLVPWAQLTRADPIQKSRGVESVDPIVVEVVVVV